MTEVKKCPYCGNAKIEKAITAFLEMGEYNSDRYESEGNAEGWKCNACGGEFWANGPDMPEKVQAPVPSTWPTMTEAKAAIKACVACRWDDPSLLKLGPLTTTISEDVLRIKRACLEAYGYTVGERNPLANTNYTGRFMVIEAHDDDELPTEDGRDGPWCIVGDNLSELIAKAYEVLESLVIED